MDDYTPQRYAAADSIIAELKQRRAEVWKECTTGTLVSHMVFDEDRVHVVAPRIQTIIENADETAQLITERIERWEMRGRLYRQFMAEHPHPTADEVQEGLLQIETYVAYHQGYEPPEESVSLSDDPLSNVADMAHYFMED